MSSPRRRSGLLAVFPQVTFHSRKKFKSLSFASYLSSLCFFIKPFLLLHVGSLSSTLPPLPRGSLHAAIGPHTGNGEAIPLGPDVPSRADLALAPRPQSLRLT